jgi:CheY-like chemotaxis protein
VPVHFLGTLALAAAARLALQLIHHGQSNGNGYEPAGRQVLVIDDEAAVREVVSEVLELEGIVALAASNGEQGLELFRSAQQDIGLIILDFSLPGLSGPATLQALRRMDLNIPIILASGHSEQDVRRFVADGISGYLEKPFTLEGLVDLVLGYLQQGE